MDDRGFGGVHEHTPIQNRDYSQDDGYPHRGGFRGFPVKKKEPDHTHKPDTERSDGQKIVIESGISRAPAEYKPRFRRSPGLEVEPAVGDFILRSVHVSEYHFQIRPFVVQYLRPREF